MKKPKKAGKPMIRDMTMEALQKDLAHCKKALGNAKMEQMSKTFYSRRREMLDAEIEKRQPQS